MKVVQKWNPNYNTAPIIGSTINTAALTQSSTTDYAGNIIYENNTLKRILVDGGYNEEGKYYFYITDHLGNNRILADAAAAVVQGTHYYPFGMPFADGTGKDVQPYKYNGKLDSRNGLNMYDYSARQYESSIGRFTSVDPLAEKYYSISPYVYVMNNPLKYIDPDGKAPMGGPGGGPIILGGPNLIRGVNKIFSFLLNTSDVQDAFVLSTAILAPVSGKPAATFESGTNESGLGISIEYKPASGSDIEAAKQGALIPAVSGGAVNKVSKIETKLVEKAAKDVKNAESSLGQIVVTPHGEAVPIPKGAVVHQIQIKGQECLIKEEKEVTIWTIKPQEFE